MSTDDFLHRFLDEDRVIDPQRAAQKSLRRDLPRRFYRQAKAELRDGLWALTLDGKGAKTPARKALALASRPLAEAIAAEWQAQDEHIVPSTMPVTRLANVAIDRVGEAAAAIRAELAAYAGSDLLCYRAGDPERLVERQNALWNPVLAWAEAHLGAPFRTATGIIHVAQSAAALASARQALEAVTDPLRLAALHVVTTMTGSLLLALQLERHAASPQEVWAAAHVDEDVQIEIWGEDDEALLRRAARRLEFDAAALVLAQPLG